MKRAYGFTIVELLIVIVVIAILAAISVAAYSNISSRANDSAVQSDATAIAKILEMYKVENGSYPVGSSQFPEGFKITKKAYATNVNNMMFCHSRITDQYNLAMVSKSGKGWWVTSGKVEEKAGATSSTSAICTEVGATWANNSGNAAVHGYNVGTGLWYPGWFTAD